MDLLQMASWLLSQIVAWATSHALVVGVAVLAAAVVARALGRAWGLILLAFGTFFATILAVWEYAATGSPLLPAALLAAGILVSGLLGRLLRSASLVGAIGLFAAGWYLILYAALGSFASVSVMDDIALGGLVAISALLVHHMTRRVETRPAPVSYHIEPTSM